MEPLSENSREILKETVFQLISHNQQFDKLIKEIPDKNEHISNCLRPVSELCCLSLLRSQSLQQGTSTNYGSDQCAAVLASVIKNTQGPLLSQSQKNEVDAVLGTLRVLMAEGNLQKDRFVTTLLHHKCLPLQLIWLLSKDGIMNTGTYLAKKCSTSGFLSEFGSQMKLLIHETDNTEDASSCLAGLLTELLEVIVTDRKQKSHSSSVLTAVNSVVDRAALDFVDMTLDEPEVKTLTFVKAFEKLEVAMETMKKAVSHFLSLVLSYKPVTKVSQAIQLQANWCYSKASALLTDWYKQLLLPLTTEEVLEKLQRILEQQEVNWQLLLTFISTVIVCLTDAPKTFLDFTDKLLQEGLENCDMESMITGLLLVRQACFHGPHVFMSYADWFQRTFSESSRSLANSRKSFIFLMKFLTDIMPYETAVHLKVHILRPPFVPPKCRDQLADYVLLAKTRLEDLKESLEVSGQDDLKSADESKQQEQLQIEVENAVSVFTTSGKIPSSIMEASIFKKPYYVGKFLPALLKPRPLPSVPDAKMKLIEALKKSEKIPTSMYITYEKACKKETIQLTEGLFLDLDSDDDMELSPLEQLENSLSQFHLTVQVLCGNTEEISKLTVKEAVCSICEKIEAVLSIAPDQLKTREQGLMLDVDKPGIPQLKLQVIDVLLNTIGQALYTTYSSQAVDFTWLCLLLKGISQYTVLIKDLLLRIWSLIFTQEQNLENHHIDSLAAILVEFQRLGDQLPWIQLSGRCSQCCFATRTFTEHVYQMIPVSDGNGMTFTLRLTGSYMKYVISSQEENNISSLVLPVVVKKLMYTATRLLPELRYLEMTDNEAVDQNDHFVVSLLRSPVFKDLVQNMKFTFTDWLSYEITVDTENDLFTDMERYEYYSWAVYQYFLPMSVEQGGFSRDFRLAASQVLQVIVTGDSRHQEIGPTCGKCDSTLPVRLSSSRNHLISLLQELTRMFEDEYDSGREARLPWLPRQLTALCDTTSSSVQTQAVVHSFFRIALCLPAHLMFSDRHRSEDIKNMKEIAKFFNTYLVEYVGKGVHLPLSWTLYILKGLKTATSDGSFSQSVDLLSQRCPIVPLSILVHHNQSDYFLDNSRSSGRMSEVLKALECARHNTVIPPDLKSGDWLSAAVLFSKALTNNFEDLSRCFPVTENKDKVLCLLAELLVLHWSSLQMCMPQQMAAIGKIPALVVKLLTSDIGSAVLPYLLRRNNGGLPSQCCRETVLQFRLIAVMRILEQLPPKMFVQRFSNNLTELLELFTEVAQTFERLCPENSGLPGLQQLPSLDELISYNKYVKEVIVATPARTLKTISQRSLLCVFKLRPTNS